MSKIFPTKNVRAPVNGGRTSAREGGSGRAGRGGPFTRLPRHLSSSVERSAPHPPQWRGAVACGELGCRSLVSLVKTCIFASVLKIAAALPGGKVNQPIGTLSQFLSLSDWLKISGQFSL